MKMLIRMRRWGLMGLLYLLLAVALVLPQAGEVLAWSGDPTVNTPICTAVGTQGSPQIISDGAGGAIITWQDSRNGNNDIYVQRVDSSGTAMWSADGVAICTAVDYQGSPQIISDGAGGAIITWQDSRSSTNNDIYAQRVDSSGTAMWSADGVAICTASRDQDQPRLTSDGDSGAIITWEDGRVSQNDIYAQRVNSSGIVQWTANGVAICTRSSFQYDPEIISDGAGGAIISWHDMGGIMYDIYAQRVDSSGGVQWAANGVVICNAANNQVYTQLISDGSAGAIITWQDYRSGASYDIYARRVDSGGNVLWPADGVPICTASGWQTYPDIVSDGSGGAIITWYDTRNGDTNADIYAQRVNSGGAVQWIVDGVPICNAALHQQNPQLISYGPGGAIITWNDARSSTNDIYAQMVDSGGAVQWTADGVAICTAASHQYNPQIIADGSNGAIIVWKDSRVSGDDIYAQGVDSGGSLSSTPRANSQTSLKSSPSTSNYGQLVTLTATVKNKRVTPTGTITFMDGATVIASDMPLVGHQATFTTNALMPGKHAITAVYSGDANFAGSTSSIVNQEVVRDASTSTAVVSSLNPSQQGNSVTFTTTVSTAALGLGTPTGMVTFRDGKVILHVIALDGAGQATFTTTVLSIGRHSISVTYSGDSNFSGSSGSLRQRVNR